MYKRQVQFAEDGSIEALSTVDHAVHVRVREESAELFHPGVKNNVCGDERKVSVPMKVRFAKSQVMFHDNPKFTFDLEHTSFEIRTMDIATKEPAFFCA